jgi:hypothetical protein
VTGSGRDSNNIVSSLEEGLLMKQFAYTSEGSQSSGPPVYSTLGEPLISEQAPLGSIDEETSLQVRSHRSRALLRAGTAMTGLALGGVLVAGAGCASHPTGKGTFEPGISASPSPKPPTVAGTSTPEGSTQCQLQQPEVYAYRGQPVCDMVNPGTFARTFNTDVNDISSCDPDSPWSAAEHGVISSGTWVQKSTGLKYEVIVTHDIVDGHSQFDDKTANVNAVELYNVAVGNAPELTGFWDQHTNTGAIRSQTANEGMLDIWYVFDNSAANGGGVAPLTDPALASKIIGYDFSGQLIPEVFEAQNLHD